MADEALTKFVDTLKHRPTHVDQSHNLEGRGGLKWLHLSYRYPGTKLEGVGAWLTEIRDELHAHGVTVREIKANYHFLNPTADQDGDCLVTAKFSVNSSEELEQLNEAFLQAAKGLLNRK